MNFNGCTYYSGENNCRKSELLNPRYFIVLLFVRCNCLYISAKKQQKHHTHTAQTKAR